MKGVMVNVVDLDNKNAAREADGGEGENEMLHRGSRTDEGSQMMKRTGEIGGRILW
jgi:hypothetical protein